jgi:hypothetical protein
LNVAAAAAAAALIVTLIDHQLLSFNVLLQCQFSCDPSSVPSLGTSHWW